MPERQIGLTFSRAQFLEFVRYVLIGGMTFALFLTISTAPKVVPDIPYGVASGLALFLAGIFNFSAQYIFTFRSTRPLKSTALRYLLLVSFNSVCAGFIADYLIHTHGLNSVVANVLCAFSITPLSYLAMRIFVM